MYNDDMVRMCSNPIYSSEQDDDEDDNVTRRMFRAKDKVDPRYYS